MKKMIEGAWQEIERRFKNLTDEQYLEAIGEIADRATDAFNAKQEEMGN